MEFGARGAATSVYGAGLAARSIVEVESNLVETLTDALMERVERLLQTERPRREWGSPLLSTTPTSLGVQELAAQVEALEQAVREIALEVQRLSAQR